MAEELNVLGQALQSCSVDPMTGFFRDGCCRTHPEDLGQHVVCAEMTPDFLRFSRERGNDLSTPRPEYGFSGLQPGDRWCLCATRWVEALLDGVAPPVVLAATHEAVLELVSLETLVDYALDWPKRRP
ncbi:DUF2237 family protein [Chitinimonas lacunae]|uniref:DUF2237 family protein n=1 Tax=Chitinimonas lacunae TaxID=1963018 RepID=A0ABV8MV50_9NEIS